MAEFPLRLEQAVTDAGVAGQHEVEKRAETDRVIGEIEGFEQINFAGLIEQAGDGRDDDAEFRQRAKKIAAHYSAALRMAFHSRSALASRGETSG